MNYAYYQLKVKYKWYAYMIAGLTISLTALLWIIIFSNKGFNQENYTGMFYDLGIALGFVYAGIAFSDFRKKEQTIYFLLLPASKIEKFIFEFLLHIVAFMLAFPVIYFLAAKLALIMYFGKADLLSITNILKVSELTVFKIVIYFSLSSIAFLGASSFRKYPVLKTLTLIGIFVLIIFLCLYFLSNLQNIGPDIKTFFRHLFPTLSSVLKVSIAGLVIISFTVIFYSYFKIKEKTI